MYDLRNYQTGAINELRAKFQSGLKRVLIVSPTGTGKGLLISQIAHSIASKNIQVAIITAGREIVFQTRENLHKYHKIFSSIIMGNEKGFDKNAMVQICSIDTLNARDIDFIKTFKYIMVDECHLTNANRYQNFFSSLSPSIFNIGFSATPYNYLTTYEDYIVAITPREARDQGFLVPTKYFAPTSQINTSDVKISSTGDYNNKQLHEASAKITGDIIRTWIEKGENRPTICFGVNKDHSRSIAEEFNRNNIKAIHLDDSATKEERQSAIEKIKTGEIKILCNIAIFSVGFDLPELSCLIHARPTKSEIFYIQSIGRVLRPCKNKDDAIILDHAGNIFEHGTPYDQREIRVGAKPKKINDEKIIRVSRCEECGAVYEVGIKECPLCGYVNIKKEREINIQEGELSTIDHIDLLLIRMRKTIAQLQQSAKFMKWKPNSIYFKLYSKFGDNIFQYKKELQLPEWLYNVIQKNKHNNTQEL